MKKLTYGLIGSSICIFSLCSCSQNNSLPTTENFFLLNMNGQTYHIQMPSDSVFAIHKMSTQPETDIYAWKVPVESKIETFGIRIYGDSITGNFPARMSILLPSGASYSNNLWNTSPTDTITITEFGAINNYVTGSFTGKVISDATTTDTLTFTCTFRVKRLE
jgi:hypothetical protein